MQLEIRNLQKSYRIKGGDSVKALDGVSLRFPETGLVFILGKSGSGKSTLLNVMGGLDKADDGEIIINNKSSKDFNGSEMDSYRNTYLGFIFQEYNILNDFTVKENIALALELQHKKADEDTIDAILKEVDLRGYEKRKPNELSGGQKQRVAIARALVKEPKIIFADEPTGALDSNTGKQVFDTLKKLAETRLVVVVSHDREFAEYYGDRVIELQDGRVISDITKKENEPTQVNDGVKVLKNNLIRVKKGYQLSSVDLAYINNLTRNASEDTYISFDQRINKAICTSAMISDSGKVQSFFETDNDKVVQGDEEWRVIKSKFPIHAAFRMGAKSLKVKPFRLFMTILLSIISFTFFGISITSNLTTKTDIISSAITTSNETSLLVSKVSNWSTVPVTETVLNELNNKVGLTDDGFKAFYTLNNGGIELNPINFPYDSYGNQGGQSIYYVTKIRSSMAYSDVSNFLKPSDIYIGSAPNSDDEVLITKHTFETFTDYGVNGLTKEQIAANPSAIIGFTIGDYKISGVIDTKVDLSKFTDYKEGKATNTYSATASQILKQYSDSDYHGAIYLKNKPASDKASSYTMIAPTNRDRIRVKNVIERLGVAEENYSGQNGNGFVLRNAVGSIAVSLSSLLDVLKTVFLILGIVTAVFSTLLFYNFISISINNRRREIGILRAVGSRGMDVFKIFFSESGIIAFINFVVSTVLTFVICNFINNSIADNSFMSFNILFPGLITILAIFAIALLSGFISSYLPTMKLAHQKPIDAIREK